MIHDTKRARRVAPLPVATLAALLLAGCSSGYIGESWQCPLAEGGSCGSVAAADPAVPRATGGTVLGEPLWRVRAAETDKPPARGEPAPAREPAGRTAEPSCAADCDGGFDPFAWLARLFGAESVEGEARSAGRSAPASSASQLPGPVSGEDAAAPAAARTAEPEAEPFPAEDGPSHSEAGQDGPVADDLRTGEVVARIWIAPFVDGDGVYREASHVRVVLEPAGWKLR